MAIAGTKVGVRVLRLASLGSNLIMIFAGAPSTRGIRGAVGDYSRLTLEDAKAIRTVNPEVADLYPEAEGDVQLVYKNKTPDTMNRDPYGDGWVCEIEMTAPDQVSALLDAAAYQALIEG